MAEGRSLLEEDFNCPICCDIFKGPVVLKCSHSLCEECLREYWGTQAVLQCPVCRKECSPDEPTRSLAFTSLCENFKNRKCAAAAVDICPEHDEKLKLFCFEDKQPICVVCYTSKKHKDHHCSPIVEAVEDLKAEVKSGISGLRHNLQILNKSKAEYELLAETIKDERQNVEKMLRQEFDSLHQVLKEEEEARILALREEEMKKYEKTKKRIEKLSSEILNLSMTIQVSSQKMEMDEITFLQHYANNHYSPAKYMLPEPDMISGIDTAKHLRFLNLNLQAKMCELLKDPPQLVTLDPNTASNKLVVSEDMCSVFYVEQKLTVPDNPERLYVGVLGSQGFRSGLHCWDVEVGDNDHWTVGVVKESIERKKLLKMDPCSGMWSIRFTSGKYRVGVKARKELSLPEKPRVIRVLLDCDSGTVTFSDPSKGPSVYTFTDTFTETLFPYFNTASTVCPLRIS
ncbi:nuclear factor 7, brain [Electrophorus electricus]|uniref:Tripartite motif containing 35-13 n=1 Tax=Electrophorus electricus TaxID=8005 RepID=A0A4W4DX27_ELEEL|nr:nuclear factor 7, brain [Electrophorus electricus]